jgi:predicted O-methyltransferase YrrM
MLFAKLVGIYQQAGFAIRSSISPFMLTKISNVSHEDGTFTYIVKDGANYGANGGGISMSEVYLIDSLASVFKPATVFGIGCSFGWSSVALAVANPGAKVVAIDIAEGTSAPGLDLTNEIAKRHALNLSGHIGRSPEDVAPIVERELGGRIDLVFIDADHHDEPQYADFRAVVPYCHPGTVYLFHDVIICQTLASFKRIAAEMPSHEAAILTRTASGIGALIPKSGSPELRATIAAFADTFCPVPV